jgi:dihydropteroate synthase
MSANKQAMSAALPAYRIMGIVNVTPDSFSDGGDYLDPRAAIEHALELAAQGADIVDVGGESTRPGSVPVGSDEELRRVMPVLEGLAGVGCAAKISIDTSKSGVARAALDAGAQIVNDVTALRGDPEMAELIAARGAECCLVHTRPYDQPLPSPAEPDEVVEEVLSFLAERLELAVGAGIARGHVWLDPGIGFGKTAEHNLVLLSRLGELAELGCPILIGTSRKRFLGQVPAEAAGLANPVPVEQRLPGTIATNVLALERGARVFRVHDVAPVRDALALAAATLAAHG